ncbi:hypothetical protein [Rahnella selenatireducens]|uniref:hypothetical protein n=1 Tax=Rahnella selenatireducens TaxID=3389797 RepID=UPI0039691B22
MESLAHHNRRAGGGVNVGFLSGLFARITGQKPEQSTEQTPPYEELKMAKVLVTLSTQTRFKISI